MMKLPFEIEGKGIIPAQGACNTAVAWDVNFTFADGVKMRFRGTRNNFDQVNPMNDFKDWEAIYGKIADHGTAFEGSDGWIMVRRGEIRTSPEKLATDRIGPKEFRLPQSANHGRNFIDSVKSRQPAICPIEDAVHADLLCHLGDLATRLDRKLFWDPAKEQFIKDPDANRRLKLRPMRAPWKF
jgi:hypothetical protein